MVVLHRGILCHRDRQHPFFPFSLLKLRVPQQVHEVKIPPIVQIMFCPSLQIIDLKQLPSKNKAHSNHSPVLICAALSFLVHHFPRMDCGIQQSFLTYEDRIVNSGILTPNFCQIRRIAQN